MWYDRIKTGDTVCPVPLWNKTSRHTKLEYHTIVQGVRRDQTSETGTMFLVHFKNGDRDWLDANWFTQMDELCFDPSGE